jgi:Flp pilus assembly protein TadD
MRIRHGSPLLWLSLAALVAPGSSAYAQAIDPPAKPGSAAGSGQATGSAQAAPANSSDTSDVPNRGPAYFHAAMAALYEEQAVNSGKPEYVQHAVDEYKAAINADPDSAELQDALASLYFNTGRAHEAESTARLLLKIHPDDVDAHKLLGRFYLRQLGEQQNSVSSASPSGNTLDQAIAEFEKIVSLQPKSVEDHMVLGQLYTVKHQSAKAEQQFNIAKEIEPESEDVVLNLARVYAENGNVDQAAKVIEAVPEGDRTARMEFTLGAT